MCDLNRDGEVDLKDRFEFRRAFRSHHGDRHYLLCADLNHDGSVDVADRKLFNKCLQHRYAMSRNYGVFN